MARDGRRREARSRDERPLHERPREERTGYRSGDPELTPEFLPDAMKKSAGEPAFYCDLCGAEMLNRHCKLLCLRCGYQRDCSDP